MAARASSCDDTEGLSAAAFWRAPIGPPPEDVAAPVPAKKDLDGSRIVAEAATAAAEAAEREARKERERKVLEYLLPMPIEEMSYDMLKERLTTFQHQWYARHGRRITPEDEKAGRVPIPVIMLYNELGKRLSPEQVAADLEASKARAAAEAEVAAKAAAEAETAAAAKAEAEAAVREARDKEWAAFEASREDAWKSATMEAKDQRIDVAGKAGGLALSGAASFLKPDDCIKDSRPTLEEYVQQCREEFFGPQEEDNSEAIAEAEGWRRGGGAEADAIAFREAWEKKQADESAAALERVRANAAKAAQAVTSTASPSAEEASVADVAAAIATVEVA